MNGWGIAIFGVAGFGMAVLSGIAGAGGGFVMIPLGIMLGMTPAQAVSTGKFSGVSIAVGSLVGMGRQRQKLAWIKMAPVLLLAFLVGLAVPYAIKNFQSDSYKIIMAVLLLITIPIVIFKHLGLKARKTTKAQRTVGSVLLAFALSLQGIFGGGIDTLVNVTLMGLLGMSVIQANITKRWSQLVLNATIIVGVFGSGLIVWKIAAIGIVATLTGSYIGGRIATHKSSLFVTHIMVFMMLLAAVFLIAA